MASFYHTLMISEANHYTMFITLARKYFDREKVDEMWEGLLGAFEAEVISNWAILNAYTDKKTTYTREDVKLKINSTRRHPH